jgi:glycosyltransferase involved in cell wall biosynthesis
VTRVLSVLHHPFFGGPQNQVLRLAGPLRERGFSTLAVVPDEPGNAYERLVAGGVEVVRMPLGRIRRRLDWRTQRVALRLLAGDVPRLRQLIKSERIDLVVVHGLVNPQGALAARLCGRAVVWQLLETILPLPVRLAYAPLVRLLASSVMSTGQAVARAHPGIPHDAGRLFTFFPPVDTQRFAPDDAERISVRSALGVNANETFVGCVANFAPLKGLDTFLAVARAVCEARTDVRFALFGRLMETHADYAEELLLSAADLRGQDRLILLDPAGDVPAYLRALDVFLASGTSEGLPTTILEAMSTSLPVVSTDIGAIHEAVTHAETGFLCPPGDLESLIRHVMRLVGNPNEREALGSAGRERAVAEFDVERCADVHARAFEAALARHGH